MPRPMLARYRLLLTFALATSVALCLGVTPPSRGETPDRPVKPPPGAMMLFDGKDLSGWVHRGSGRPGAWRVADGYMEVVPGTGDLHTRQEFTDFQLHVEFWLPLMPDARGQARANSGVYLQGRYEVQVLDSFGIEKPGLGDCGAIYGVAVPRVNACKPPEQWQSYDITFRAPRFANGQLVEKARVSVIHNGVKIHENQEIPGATTASMGGDPSQPGPIMLQDHGCKIRYRNIWLLPARK